MHKYMKGSASESIRNACFNLERLKQFFPPSPAVNFGWSGFDSGPVNTYPYSFENAIFFLVFKNTRVHS